MVEEAAVLGGEHGLDDVIRHLVDGHRIALDDAAPADLVAVAVDEGDGEIALVLPVAGGDLEGRHGERQEHHRAGRAHRQRLAGEFGGKPPPAAHTEAAEEYGGAFPPL